ncbi:MAG: helix-turn-helix transcriptional regulator [Nitrospirae bacterium]|nr:helix-turn-helix transcriptional regulator [Magnetococcales bacterium]HAT50974.1 transcriptional regulator [Alphaproteobacteria bacterium]
MSELTEYQTIMQDGKPAFVVIPYEDFQRLLPEVATVHSPSEHTIPHTVAKATLLNGVSLVRAWREYLGLTQAELADRMGITQAALSQMEQLNAKLRKPTLEKLAIAMDLSVKQLR